MKKYFLTYTLIAIGSLFYGLGTVIFIFPNEIIFGGTSGLSIILARWLPFTPGEISVVSNITLLLLAFIILGRSMAIKTTVGSLLTTVFIGLFEKLLYNGEPFFKNNYLCAIIGAAIIAIASGIMFYVDSSSGGTDIIALIIKKYVNINVGRALLFSDVVIVIGGGIIAGLHIAIPSFSKWVLKACRVRCSMTLTLLSVIS